MNLLVAVCDLAFRVDPQQCILDALPRRSGRLMHPDVDGEIVVLRGFPEAAYERRCTDWEAEGNGFGRGGRYVVGGFGEEERLADCERVSISGMMGKGA